MLLSALFESTSIYLVVSFSDFGPVIPHSKTAVSSGKFGIITKYSSSAQ